MAAKFGVPVTPHAGGVGLCEYVIHLRYEIFSLLTLRLTSASLIDYIAVSGSIDRNVLEYVDHLHEVRLLLLLLCCVTYSGAALYVSLLDQRPRPLQRPIGSQGRIQH